PDGEEPSAGLTGFKGLLYGTTSLGGYDGSPCNACGTVYMITATGKERVLYRFAGPPDGEFPGSNLSEANGVLFGTTYSGGSSSCSGHCGVVFK
ncbi:MAG: choice-of-anchor tandem repeat GloVer-containing protein, partial [Candidatus Cybelea sp.]